MRKHSSMYFGLLAVLLAVVMIATTLINAGAATNGISNEEIDAIVNTTTDASQVTSPFIEVANNVRNSVVGVNNYTTTNSYYGYGYGYGRRQTEPRESLAGTGSGVVISNYGHVLTNYHVVEGATRVTVTTALDESEHEANVVGYDADLDIAVLQVPGLDLKAVALGDSDQLQVGEWAIVIGNPLGEDFARTLTVGVVSAIDREVKDSTTDRYGRRTTISNTMIQVDAAINSGNSGGGLFNTLGQLQGIPARKYSSNGFFSASIDNIGMCIPINVAKPLIEQVLKDYDGNSSTASGGQSSGNNITSSLEGKPRLGVTVSSFSGTNNVLPQGAVVKAVEENSPAAEGGIQVGDIIVEVDGDIISSYTDLTKKLSGYQEGAQLAVKVYRDEALASQIDQYSIDLSQCGDGEYIDLTVTLRIIDNLNM
ncbi:MAG: trypsin-like peptidase domain-containing protein [Clostridia bacterium]|nr:trypsin-like peptidase domain-containing protein [Clostridia bacterium]